MGGTAGKVTTVTGAGDTKMADKAFAEYGGGERGQRAYDAIMAHPEAHRERAYNEKTWDPTHYADKAFQEFGGQRAYDAVMGEPVGRRFQVFGFLRSGGFPKRSVSRIRATLAPADEKPVETTPALRVTFSQTPNAVGVWGCVIPGTDPRAAGASREDVERMCFESRSCVGYYADDTPGKTWYLATDTDPARCTVKGREIYPSFYRKSH